MMVKRASRMVAASPRVNAEPIYEWDTMFVAITIATYRRPSQLRNLLSSLAQSLRPELPAYSVIVVDNDPDESARESVAGSPLKIEYRLEARPGIVAARNCALEKLPERTTHVVFVDDDEVVAPDWYEIMCAAAAQYGAGTVVSGPVIPRYPVGAPRWIVRGDFHGRRRYPTGSNNPFPATNNTIVPMSAMELLTPPYFDEQYSHTGGSDSDLFFRLRAAHVRFVWCDEALVHEDVPLQRATFRWIWRRNVRLGNVARRVTLRRRNSFQVASIGLARVAGGIVLVLGQIVRGRLEREAFAHIPKGVGMIQSAFGGRVLEYKRRARGMESR